MAPVFQGGDLCVIMEKGPHKNHCLSDFVQISVFFACNPFKLCGPRFPSTIYKRRWTLKILCTTELPECIHGLISRSPRRHPYTTASEQVVSCTGEWLVVWSLARVFSRFFSKLCRYNHKLKYHWYKSSKTFVGVLKLSHVGVLTNIFHNHRGRMSV